MPKSHPPALLYKVCTPRTLAPFNEQNGERILLSIKGIVFDVTAGRSFHGPDGMYANFAGRDASRGMAKQSFEEEMMTPIDQPLDKLDNLSPSDTENTNGDFLSAVKLVDSVCLIGWMDRFSHKYIICGKLVNNEEFRSD